VKAFNRATFGGGPSCPARQPPPTTAADGR